MSTDEPAPRPDLRGEPRSQGGRQGRVAERSYLSLIPWRNFRRAFFLILALGAILVLKRSAGGFFRTVLDSVAPPPASPARTGPETTVHLQSRSPAR
jgi:hypothetical protein